MDTALQLDALRESVEHWTRLSQCVTVKQFDAEGWKGKQCACCREFHTGYKECYNCPIRQFTGFHECSGTPYADAASAINDFVLDEMPSRDKLAFVHRRIDKELAFLRDTHVWLSERTATESAHYKDALRAALGHVDKAQNELSIDVLEHVDIIARLKEVQDQLKARIE